MTSLHRNVLLLGLLSALIGCGKASSDETASASQRQMSGSVAMTPEEEAPSTSRSGKSIAASSAKAGFQTTSIEQNPVLIRRQVIRKGELGIRAPNVEKGERAAEKIVSSLGGYVDSASSTDLTSDKPNLKLTVRVPSASFETALQQFEGLGTRLSKSVSSEDVTGQLVDLDARIRTLTAEEASFQAMLRQARSIAASMEIQDRLTQVVSEIESISDQRKTLGGLASTSTITIDISQDAAGIAPPKDRNWVAQTWGEALGSVTSALRSVLTIGIWLAAFAPIWIPIGLGIRALVRPRLKSSAT